MGLDMWLYVRQNISDYSWEEGKDKNKLDTILDAAGWTRDEIDSPSANVDVPAVYWRKANAIHQFFVDNFGDGVDNCTPINVSYSGLKELKDTCKRILDTHDEELIEEELPPASGFFFGSTEVDEWYYEYVQHTYDELDRILNKIPDNDWNYSFIYQSSW